MKDQTESLPNHYRFPLIIYSLIHTKEKPHEEPKKIGDGSDKHIIKEISDNDSNIHLESFEKKKRFWLPQPQKSKQKKESLERQPGQLLQEMYYEGLHEIQALNLDEIY